MPKFSVDEREKIQETIMSKAKALFSTYGLKKTTIDQIVEQAKIGKGTFYSFFDSKEELFFKILEQEEHFRDRLIEEMMNSNLPRKEAFKKFITDCFIHIENNPFLKRLSDKEELLLLYRKLPQEMIDSHIKQDLASSIEFIKKYQDEGEMIEEDPYIIVGLLRSLMMLGFLKDEIGDSFPKVFKLHIDFIIDGLFKKNHN